MYQLHTGTITSANLIALCRIVILHSCLLIFFLSMCQASCWPVRLLIFSSCVQRSHAVHPYNDTGSLSHSRALLAAPAPGPISPTNHNYSDAPPPPYTVPYYDSRHQPLYCFWSMPCALLLYMSCELHHFKRLGSGADHAMGDTPQKYQSRINGKASPCQVAECSNIFKDHCN